MEFSRQEYWSGLSFPTPGYLPNLGIETTSLASPVLAGGFFTTESTGKHQAYNTLITQNIIQNNFYLVFASFILFFGLATWYVGYSFPSHGLNQQPLHWNCRVLPDEPRPS